MIYAALDHRFTFECDHPPLSDFIQRLLSSLESGPDEGPGDPGSHLPLTRYHIAVAAVERGELASFVTDDERVCTTENPAEPFLRLIREINLRAVQESAPRHVVLHAAMVGFEGRSIVFPQAPGAGKSTLVAGLMRHGWTYVSDELVTIDRASLQVSGLRRAVTLRPGSWQLFADGWIEPPEAARRFLPRRRFLAPPSGIDRRAFDPGHSVLYTYRAPGETRPEIRPMDAVESLQYLLGASFTLRGAPERDLTTLARFVEQVGSWHVRAGASLTETCTALEALRSAATEPRSLRA